MDAVINKSSTHHFFLENTLKKLTLEQSRKSSPLLPSLHHFDEMSGRTRQKRSDRRQNIISVLKVIIPQMDLDTFAWGQWFTKHDGTSDFYTRGIEYLAEKTGMNIKSVYRAISDMEDKGYMQSTERNAIGKKEKQIRHYSLRKLTNKFFIEMGFLKKTIEGIKSWKRKDNEKRFYSKKLSSHCVNVIKKVTTSFSKAVQPVINKLKAPLNRAPVHSNDLAKRTSVDTNTAKQLLSKASYLAQRDGRNPMDVYRELLASL